MSTREEEAKRFLVCLLFPHVSVSMYFTVKKKKNQHFIPLYCPTSKSRKAEEKYQKEKDRCCNIGNFSVFKLNGSILAIEHISPNPFPGVDLGIVFSRGQVSFWQSKSGG